MNSCPEYTVPIVGQAGVTKCMTTAEYQAYWTAQHKTDAQVGMFFLFLIFGILIAIPTILYVLNLKDRSRDN